MDIIDVSMTMNRHITKNSKIIGKNWNDFCQAMQEKSLILYGITGMINFLWLRCNSNFKIIAAIDNSFEKKGHLLGEFFDEKIQSKEALKMFDPAKTVVLISSVKSYEAIAKELDNENFHCYFSILNLEANFREQMKKTHFPFETKNEYMTNYAKQIVEKIPVCNNKIFFNVPAGYTDHGKYITEQLLSMNKNLDIVWLTNNKPVDLPEKIRFVNSTNWKQYVYEMETAKVWVINAVVPTCMIKRKEQFYIQTKHWGSITLKRFYLDAAFVANVGNNKQDWQINGKWMDYIITGSEFDEISCQRGFNFDGQFLRYGSPRSDAMFLQEKYKKKIFNYFKLKNDEYTLLYAPTYRFRNGEGGNNDIAKFDLDFEMLLNTLRNKWGGSWKIFLRLHPSIRNKSKSIKLPNYVIDASNYDDGQEIVAASDIMISDFSSIMFEPAYVLKPVFLYSPDKAIYEKNDYELLIDYDSLPFPISTTNEELSAQILSFDDSDYKKNVKAFLDKYGVHEDGHASERAAKFIVGLLS